METDVNKLLPDDFNQSSRVWIYQSNRLFTMHEALRIEEMLKEFADNWMSHGIPVKGYANLFFGQFIVLVADETAHGVSGCSTDSSVKLIKDIGAVFNVNLFDRLLLAFIVKERVQVIPMSQLTYAIENNFVGPDTLYFDNTIQTLAQLRNQWLVPVRNSWMARDNRFSGIFDHIADGR